MNYRHAFHAGNFADVFKHLLLSRILIYLARKPAPFRFVDTHAGIGRYDLAGPDAARTGEWRDGIGRLHEAIVPAELAGLVAPYLAAVGPRDTDGRPLSYPGSPTLAQRLLRPQDRLLLCERHPADVQVLRRAVGRDPRATVRADDGYAALNAVLPPPERRGLVLIDPPFEDRDEFGAVVRALRTARRKWATGTVAVWYAIKDPGPVAGFAAAVAELAGGDRLWLELARAPSAASTGLRGCGMLVVNPPFVLADEARRLLPFLAGALTPPGRPPFRSVVRAERAAPGG